MTIFVVLSYIKEKTQYVHCSGINTGYENMMSLDNFGSIGEEQVILALKLSEFLF